MKDSTKNLITQIGVALFGVAGIAMSYSGDPAVKHLSPVLGMASQPFWFYMTWRAKLWGAFFTTFLYTASWSFGIYQNFFK